MSVTFDFTGKNFVVVGASSGIGKQTTIKLSQSGAGDLLPEKIRDVLSGRLTKAEAYGFSDIAVDHVCRFV